MGADLRPLRLPIFLVRSMRGAKLNVVKNMQEYCRSTE